MRELNEEELLEKNTEISPDRSSEKEPAKKPKKKLTKKRLALRIALCTLGAILLIVGGYLIYVFAPPTF